MHDPEGTGAEREDDSVEAIQIPETQSHPIIGAGDADPARGTDAENEVAAAEARAQAARARVVRLRRATENQREDGDDAEGVEQRPTKSIRGRLRRQLIFRRSPKLRRPGPKAVALVVGGVLAAASLGASGYMLQQHRVTEHRRQLSQEYAAAARQAVITLMSIDVNHARDDIQRIIDASSSPLKDQLSVMSQLMLQQAEEAKTITKVSVEAVAVESPNDKSAVALVVAKTNVTDTENKKRPPQLWRISVEIVREGGQFKISKVDFLQ